ncbi:MULTISPECIES: sulfur carrier protein ThiS [unclassified Variovorax]|uniref:sulfur carrier protein ThiS n=1 Tax=unclassified Variovorax TaxID=663243 RepID=UPI001BD40044|nr:MULTISPECIES: sulfur carrier protein ThiS [unclassified Variovorax]
MNILINDTPRELPTGASLADAIALLAPAPPFAAAVNKQFVPRSGYAARTLQDDDLVEVIRPVTGG